MPRWPATRRSASGVRVATAHRLKKDPAIIPVLQAAVEPETAGDPMSEQQWLRSSLRHLSARLGRAGHPASPPTVARLLSKLGYALHVNAKKLEASADRPDRQAQFEHIAEHMAAFAAAGLPTTRGLQRYRCKDCGKTFDDHTGTSMARTKRLDKWEKFTDCMIDRRTCREAAKIVGTISRPPSKDGFGPLPDPCAVLCTDGSRILRAFVREVGVEHHALNTSKREYKRGIYHIQHVNVYHSRLEARMEVFHGVATKYLANSMAWHVFYEQAQSIQRPAAREIVLVNSSPIPTQVVPSRCPYCGKTLSVRSVA